jgi:hypothetical protein
MASTAASRAAAHADSSDSDDSGVDDTSTSAVAPPGLANSLIFSDMTGTKPRARVLNKAARDGTLGSGAKPPRRLAPVSALQAEEDRVDPQTRSRGESDSPTKRLQFNASTASSAAAVADAGYDSVSDIEVSYDDLLDTDDSEDGVEEMPAGSPGSTSQPILRRKKQKELESRQRSRMKLANPPQLSATMLVLSGVQLPSWPHTAESEDDIDEVSARV